MFKAGFCKDVKSGPMRDVTAGLMTVSFQGDFK